MKKLKSFKGRKVLLSIGCVILWMSTHAADGPKANSTPAFFAFDNGVGLGKWSPEEQATTLKELGYAGIGYTGVLGNRNQAFEARGLRVFSLYVGCTPGKTPAYAPHLMEGMKQLEGTGVVLWLTVLGPTNDEDAARVVQEIADTADPLGVKIALYPHAGFHVATATDAVRLVKKVDRSNVGVTINLCHELKAGNGEKLGDIVKEAAPYLSLVSINGADRDGRSWEQLIQPLGEGDFDVAALLAQLWDAGYTGPIGLQCYGVKGDQKTNLKKSIEAWTLLTSASSLEKESL